MLQNLTRYDFTTLSIPTISKKINGHARLKTVKSSVIISTDKITEIQLRAIQNVYYYSYNRIRIQDCIAWQVINSNMEFLRKELAFINTLPQDKSKKIIHDLRTLYNSIPTHEKIPVSISHGVFTPWNLYCDDQRLFVYDWEMARTGMPMLFDLFHFTFQSTLLTHRKGFKDVEAANRRWQQHIISKSIQENWGVQTDLHFKLYLLFTVSYYIRQCLRAKELPLEGNLMLDAWGDALEYCNVNSSSLTE
jgi:hypothetical protein